VVPLRPRGGTPRTALFWRSSTTVTDVLGAPREPPVIQFESCLPEACLLAPEQVTEYPNPMELSEEQLGEVSRWETVGSAWDSTAAVDPAGVLLHVCPASPGHPHIELIQ